MCVRDFIFGIMYKQQERDRKYFFTSWHVVNYPCKHMSCIHCLRELYSVGCLLLFHLSTFFLCRLYSDVFIICLLVGSGCFIFSGSLLTLSYTVSQHTAWMHGASCISFRNNIYLVFIIQKTSYATCKSNFYLACDKTYFLFN